MKNQATQLELELGILTDSQQERVNSFIKSQKSNTESIVSTQAKIEDLLINGGFEIGIDYINDLKYGLVTENKKFGYEYSPDAFEANVTYMKSSGGCKILFDKYNSTLNKVELGMSIVEVTVEHDKLECPAITSQYRAYKPSSLFQKLKENNEKAQLNFNKINREKSLSDYTLNKYKTLFPKAEVTVGTDYDRNYRNDYREFPIVMVKFESGSYINFRLGYENDKEYIHKKFDAVASKLTAIELLNIFDKQNISAS